MGAFVTKCGASHVVIVHNWTDRPISTPNCTSYLLYHTTMAHLNSSLGGIMYLDGLSTPPILITQPDMGPGNSHPIWQQIRHSIRSIVNPLLGGPSTQANGNAPSARTHSTNDHSWSTHNTRLYSAIGQKDQFQREHLCIVSPFMLPCISIVCWNGPLCSIIHSIQQYCANQ